MNLTLNCDIINKRKLLFVESDFWQNGVEMKFSVLGCGRWGSFITWYLSSQGHQVLEWGRENSNSLKILMEKGENEYVKLNPKVKLSSALKSRPVSLSSEGEISLDMERVLSTMPGGVEGVKAEKVLEINANHTIFEKLKKVYLEDKQLLKDYAEILYFSARLTLGLEVNNSSEITQKIVDIISK